MAVNLLGIGIDDLGIDCRCQLQRDFALAHRGWAKDYNEFVFHGHGLNSPCEAKFSFGEFTEEKYPPRKTRRARSLRSLISETFVSFVVNKYIRDTRIFTEKPEEPIFRQRA